MDDREIIAEFVIESREHLGDIESQLLAIEAAGANADAELVNIVFRAIHSIKGAAGFLGFSTVGQLAHDLENVLNLVRNRQLVPDGAVTDVLLRSADKLRVMLDDIDHSNGLDVSEYIDALQSIVAGMLKEEKQASAALPPARQPQMDAAVALPAAADPEPLPPSVVMEEENKVTDSALQTPWTEPQPAAPVTDSNEMAAAFSTAAHVQDRQADGANLPSAPSGATHVESNIRVSVNVLDRLMNLAGELVLARNQLLQALAASDHSLLGPVSARVNQVTSELQETIMQTRLQPVGTVFNRFPRVVRDLSNTLGKQCQLTIEGQEVELDKSIIEAVGDPLTHLVRNAVDHGIETADVRVRAGKPPTGTVALRAFHQAGKVNIQISDDGRGIDTAKLKQSAVSKGLITADQARTMSEREALLLIFRPGFSMAEKVTEVSGRGVGMDVVKTNIERLGGTVAVDTQPGIKTTIHVRLPLTLAIIPSLVVRCAGRRYAIPQTSIRELVRVKASDAAARIERVKRAEVFRLRGDLLPLVRLNDTLNVEAAEEDTRERAANIIVVEAGHLRYGLIVDSLCDSEEIVVKPLGRHMKGCTCMAGATILGDGNVALIVDVTGIAAHTHLAIPEEKSSVEAGAKSVCEELQTLLLFSNHPAEFFGVPMGLVARIERIRADRIDSVGGKQVLQYRGGTLPLLSLEDHLPCKPVKDASHLYVVVFAAAQREVGLLTPRLLDIRSVSTHVDMHTFREPGVVGSLVHEQMTVRLLDLHELVRKAHPDWYESTPVSTTPDGAPPRILLAEDSSFFRKQLVGFLETEGYDVLGCEDGAVAWDALNDPGNQFDLLVTDIEMPNMDGLELAGRIRNDRRLSSMPIIAVTSLAGEDDLNRARQVDVNEYLIKLDRDQLLAAINRLCKPMGSKARIRSMS